MEGEKTLRADEVKREEGRERGRGTGRKEGGGREGGARQTVDARWFT